jgi:hypothetical protein
MAFHEKSGCCQVILCLGKFKSHVFLCPDGYFVWLGDWAVKAERSELILSLGGPTAQPWQGFPGEGRHGYSPFASFVCRVFLSP